MKRVEKIRMQEAKQALKYFGAILEEEKVEGMHSSLLCLDTLEEVERIVAEPINKPKQTVKCSIEMYDAIKEIRSETSDEEVAVNTKYKTVDKKIKPVAQQLPIDSDEQIKSAAKQPSL